MKTPEFNGTIAREAIQCTCPETGLPRTWLFTGNNHRDPDSRVSPYFQDLYGLVQWARKNSWESCGDAYVFRGEGSHGKATESHMAAKHPDVL